MHFIQFALAIPAGVSSGITTTARVVNTFSNMGTFSPIIPYTETFGTSSTADDERIFGWLLIDTLQIPQSWTSGVDFTGVEVTFNSSSATNLVKMLDLSNTCTSPQNPFPPTPPCGGANENTFFVVSATLRGDIVNYTNLFYAIPGASQLGTYTGSGDQFVELIPCSGPCRPSIVTIQSSPNPFVSSAKIRYTLPKDDVVTMKVYNLRGDEVALLVNGFQSAGTKDVTFTADKLLNGIYIIRLQTGNTVESKRIVLLR